MAQVTFARVRFGPWPRFAGMEGWVKPSVPVHNRVTGAPIIVGPSKFVLDANGYAELFLPFTDSVLNSSNFDYTVRWVSGYSTAPAARKFILPSDTREVSYGALVEISTGLWAPSGSSSAPPTIGEEEPDTSTPAPSLSSSYLTHVQSTPVSTWLISHTLNRKPSVTLIVDDHEVFTDVYYPSNTSVTISWPSPTSGIAHLV